MTRRQTTAVIGVVAVLLAGCNTTAGQDTAQPPTPTQAATTETATASPSPAPSPTAGETSPEETAPPEKTEAPEETATPDGDQSRQWASCEHPDGITVEYPKGWRVNDGDTLPTCSAFDPDPLDVPDAQGFFDAAALLSIEPVDFATVADPEAQMGNEVSRRQELVDGHDAVRVETEADGDGLLDEGTRSTRWMIVLGREETLTFTTHETGDSDEYEQHRDVLDEMVTRLELPTNQ